MLTIICGEDVVTSRTFLSSLKNDYLKTGIEVRQIRFDDITEINRWLGDSPTLFSQKKVFFTEFINKKIKKDNKKFLAELTNISKLKDVELVDWEDVGSRQLKLTKIAKVKEFKPDKTIFKLLDCISPGNKSLFLNSLEQLSSNMDESFIFIMMARHVRNLILVSQDILPTKMQSWQFGKLKYQARSWDTEKLVNFYEGLMRVDIASKTGKSPYSIKESLDILACYFL